MPDIIFVVFRVPINQSINPVTGIRSPLIAYRQSLWLADMWHAYWAAGSKRSKRDKQNGVVIQVISNLVIGFPLFWN